MILTPIAESSFRDKRSFRQLYIDPKIPVVIDNFLEGSEALTKWNYEYLKQIAGDCEVAIHGNEAAHNDKVSSHYSRKSTFREYLDLISTSPTEERLFLFNLLMKRPGLRNDLRVTHVADNILTSLPYLFFGGEGSSVRNHFDIDMSHVFLSQLEGEKTVWLFANDQSDLLYKLPFNFHGIANLREPDYDQFPALKYVQGWKCTLKHGQTLFIPAGFWHYIQYKTAGYSVSYRALSSSAWQRVKGFSNLVFVRGFDNVMRKLAKKHWYQYKVDTAIRNANNAVERIETRIAEDRAPETASIQAR